MTVAHQSGREHELSLSPDRRRRDGVHYTPEDVAAELVTAAFAVRRTLPARILDPACGAGVFLLAALDALVDAGLAPIDALARVRGIDIDPEAVAIARAALVDWARVHDLAGASVPVDAVVVGDGLLVPWPDSVDAVVGNPPFGGQLRGPTVRDGRRADVAAAVLGRRAGYADTAGLFLARAVDTIEPGGVVVLLQPMSVLAARDAGVIRDRISSVATLRTVLFPDPSGFDAAVRVCAPVLVADGGSTRRAWADVAADAVGLDPAPTTRPGTGPTTLADLSEVTAGFRDEFYAVAASVVEGGSDDRRPRLVTSGSIDPGRVHWGVRDARVHGRSFLHPVVDVDELRRRLTALDGGRRLTARMAARTAPKVLVATQTRRIEAVADPDGTLWPSVPVVSVLAPTADSGFDVWDVLAVLVSPQATAFVRRDGFGTGLSGDTVRVSARALARLPLPAEIEPWRRAAALLRAGATVEDPEVLTAMDRAWGPASALPTPNRPVRP